MESDCGRQNHVATRGRASHYRQGPVDLYHVATVGRFYEAGVGFKGEIRIGVSVGFGKDFFNQSSIFNS